MTALEVYAQQVRAGLRIKPGTDELLHCVLGLVGESGEVADLFKKAQYINARPDVDRTELLQELGDVFWYFQNTCTLLGFTLEQVARANVVKLAKRHPNGGYDVRRMLP